MFSAGVAGAMAFAGAGVVRASVAVAAFVSATGATDFMSAGAALSLASTGAAAG